MKFLYLLLSLLVSLPVWAADVDAKKLPRLCAVYPHLKDSYWLSINFGMSERAKQRAIELKVLEAGGYQNAQEQWRQIELCLDWQADAILVGAVYYEKLSQKLETLNDNTPLFALVNEVSTVSLTARTGVSWYQMGAKLGEFLARKHPKTTAEHKVKLAWFPGPKQGGGSRQATLGLQDSLENSDVQLVAIKYGLNEKIRQFSLLSSTLAEYKSLDYLAGNAVMAEMAIAEVAHLPIATRPKILSHYLSHGVYRGIRRGKILMANSDQMVLQGKMAIDQAVDYLLNKKISPDQAPKILSLTRETLEQFPTALSLSPSYFKPVYSIKP
ncbi:TMAO reductase system periplasmic protein TorT [Thalassotalea sp. ND16A]|uniref:TMAO reductase system periplasmic protein TorT n=1 Tax=Thalassotalea sp. ND16A TaxID=1535422 RepID=UPI00051DBBB5|nr:TMAO reductase system periplasmic protein TorT [Thalassotalea sp. ND16A]KGJ91088.1 hypothetical protein ND16A_0164 [Thalassotalea sp. ND16A]